MAEWSNAAVLKTVVGVSPPRVRISAPPNIILEASHSWLSAPVSKTGMVVRPSEVRTLPPPWIFLNLMPGKYRLSAARVSLKKDINNIPWFVYILKCQDKTLYTGITLDVPSRLKEHNSTNKCRYTRSRKPSKLMYQEECLNHHDASCREIEIKSFSRKMKLALIKQNLERWQSGRMRAPGKRVFWKEPRVRIPASPN